MTLPVAAVLVAALAVLVTVGRSAEDDVAVTEAEHVVTVGPEPDGEQVALDLSIFRPEDADGRLPAAVLAHGFGGSKAGLEGQAREVAAQGYVVLTYTARGFGASGGRIHLNSPDYEIADLSTLLDLLAARDDVQLDGEGDPRVGVAGASYGGADALMAAAYDNRVDAVAAAVSWNDLGQSLFPNGVFKQRWASLLYTTGLQGGDGACGRFDPGICALYDEAARTGRPSEAMLRLLRRSSPAPVLDRIDAPTILVQGQSDALFPLDQADATARGIAATGTAVAVRWIDGGHDAATGLTSTADLTEPALAWFDHYLRGGPNPGTEFEFSLPSSPFDEQPPQRRVAAAYPTEGATDERSVRLSGQTQVAFSPPGGEPAAVTGLPGTGGALGAASAVSAAAYELAVRPGASAVFESEPFAESVTVVGAPRVRLSVSSTAPDATLFASAWVVRSDGRATLPRQLVAPVRLGGLPPGAPREVDLALPSSAYRVEAGQRLRVVVSSTDAAYAVPTDGRGYRIGLAADSTVRLPLVPSERLAGSDPVISVPLAIGVGALLVAALGLALSVRWRGSRRGQAPAPDGDVPLVVDGLVKAYPNGVRAVDDASWRAERGQVVGLLGPNGAGKTTSMRMIAGLIHADAGRIHVHGRPVTPGAPVLARVGALIDGPGFLPHLSGRQNLTALWAATGRDHRDAGYDEVLAIADLGAAADRPVRTYSHGMRQRLGIAQAMLGRPDVLLLDEPTTGLDPPQIRSMRGVLGRYAATGRTVVISSHLLAEVEQTCSHVVVMHRGRIVLEGAVADLVEGSETTLVGVDGADPARASEVLTGLDGVTQVDVDEQGRLLVRGEIGRSRLVAALVQADIPVTTVDGRRRLEEVFMSLVGAEAEEVGTR